MNILTFDIEEWYHLDTCSTEKDWMGYQPRIDLYLPRVLDLLDEKSIKSTFFCLGWIARQFPDVLKRIQARGHEIGCHTDKHLFVREMGSGKFRDDLRLALASIEDVTGEKVRAFRAPAFSISSDSTWAFGILAENGIEIDCSIFPASRDFGGFPAFGCSRPCIIEYKGIRMKEFPINTAKIAGHEMVYCGGGYFRLFPYRWIKYLLHRADYAISYLHMKDFDNGQPRFSHLSLMRKFKSYYGLTGSWNKFVRMLNDFQWVGLREADAATDWNHAPVIRFDG